MPEILVRSNNALSPAHQKMQVYNCTTPWKGGLQSIGFGLSLTRAVSTTGKNNSCADRRSYSSGTIRIFGKFLSEWLRLPSNAGCATAEEASPTLSTWSGSLHDGIVNPERERTRIPRQQIASIHLQVPLLI